MSLASLVEELKASVGSGQMTASQALDVLLAEVDNPSRSVPAPAQVVLRRQEGAADQIEVRVDANGNFASAVTLARALANAALAVAPSGRLL